MNKIFIFLFASCVLPVILFAQQDLQTSILTDDGIFTVSKTTNGKDMILLDISLWNDMVKGTKFSFPNQSGNNAITACIEISNKKQLHCKAGIGFRCGIFDRSRKLQPFGSLVNTNNRICSVIIQKQNYYTVKIIFTDKVDWRSLQNDQ